MARLAWFLFLLTAFGCARPAAVQDVNDADWRELIHIRTGPTAVYVWASWSRESIELLPTILELEREYEGRGVEFVYVSLDIHDRAEAQALMRELNGPPFYRIAASLEEGAAALGISGPPALIGYRGGMAQSTIEGDSLFPENAEALIEALVADQL